MKIVLNEKFMLFECNEECIVGVVEWFGEVMGILILLCVEVFDNLNIYGIDLVFVMVIFFDGKLSKNDYCKYKIKIVEGFDDYVIMCEVIWCCYWRVFKEELLMLDLILIDGGKG